MPRYDLATIVVSYNTVGLLRTCLASLTASLERFGPASQQIIVVDNASNDGSPDMVLNEFPKVKLIASPENLGFAAANNRALQSIDAGCVLFLNPDTEVLGDAPATLVHYLDEHPEVGVVGGRLLYPDLRFQHSAFRFPTLAMSFLDFFPINHRLLNSRLNGRYPRERYVAPMAIDHPLGACMLARGDVLERVGAFDEGYFMYCEEVDWCYRVKEVGWEIHYTPEAEIIHHSGASTRQNLGPMLVQLHRSRDRFFRKHYGPVFAGVARAIVRLGMARVAGEARAAAGRGEIDEAELARRLAICDQVAR